MIIRQARAEDASGIAAITNAIIRDTLVTFTTTERSLGSIVADIEMRGSHYLVAELDGQVVGFATYGPFRAGPGYVRTAEHTIQLSRIAWGQGIGRALMSVLERIAHKDGVHVLVAGISSANPGAIDFHSAIGFHQVGRMPEVGRKRDQWLDLVLMQKIIGPQ
ncbi:GNAT family acetyltransferase [Ruegeria sp. ANG-R]|uniref:GNAT family N-acetyltransferase n=1 Tax=Ruegeria sp. ANG-R TaxID=1577903 RepID=UPI00057F28F6|nr:GNAT family N-acetyltransferase [Ruegeria sp. ANG-R]KIC43272.1 GNAT family acetyltransferase [Ruegeria sp. ANG-R]